MILKWIYMIRSDSDTGPVVFYLLDLSSSSKLCLK